MWMGSIPSEEHKYYGEKDQWIELKNTTNKDISLKNFSLKYNKEKTSKENTLKKITSADIKIKAGGYFLFSTYTKGNSAINKNRDSDMDNFDFGKFQIILYDDKNNIIDTAGNKSGEPEKGDKKNFYSMERNSIPGDGSDYSNWHTCSDSNSSALYWDSGRTERGTPTPTQSDDDGTTIPDKESPYAGKISINEIFPAPKTENSGKEFVEIINFSNENITLSGMRIEDEKSHKVFLPDKLLTSKELFYLEGNFELNNTSSDTAFLIGKDGTKENPIDSVSYTDPEYDYAYAFDGSAWQWTSKITKGEKNEFDKLLSGKIKKDKDIYSNIYADFEVKADSDAKKFTWNFGDGHKSYLKKTRHKYEKAGTYQASLKITGNGKSNAQNFEVEVENFGKSKVRIISLSANPKGIDSKDEWIEISNDTKKKVNLKGWSIATGWKKLYNHPIREDFILKPGKVKRLTRDICAFTLANKQTKIELRYPNGKIADKLKYDYGDGSIGEDEVYVKNDKKWQWLDMQSDTKENQLDATQPNSSSHETATKTENPDNNVEKVDIEISPEELEASLGRFSEDPSWQAKKENRIILLGYNSNVKAPACLLENHGKVLGVEVERSEQKEVHWLKNIIAVFLRRLNLFINTFFLKISL